MELITRRTQTFLSLCLFGAVFCAPPIAFAQSDSEIPESSRALVKELMRVSGGEQVAQLMSQFFVQSFSQAIKANDPSTDPKVFTIIEEEVNALISYELNEKDALVELTTPIYMKYLDEEDLINTLEFYETETGKKFIDVMPLITQESMQAGNSWGQSLAPIIQERVMQRLEAEGLAPK